MKRPPPYLVRRLLIDPGIIALTVLALIFTPVWLLVAAFISRFVPGRWRIFRVAWFMFVYLVYESLMIIVLFVMWIASGFGWKLKSPSFVSAHYRVAGWWLARVMGSARFTFNLKFDGENVPAARLSDRPILVFSRHAGPGDSFLLIDALLNGNDEPRQPRVILKDLLQVDPVVDIVLNRLPNRWVPSTGRAGDSVVESIAELSATMQADDALVIFPEGGNFTEKRRTRAIEKLEEIGRPELADQARDMQHLLPPKPTGALTAIKAAPNADVLFVGHTGLEQLSSLGDLWRGIPMDSEISTRIWFVKSEDIPPADQQEQWLYSQWKEIDEWIGLTNPDAGPDTQD